VPSNTSRTKAEAKSVGQVRIIAGSFRGRKLGIADVAGLRPTGDRMRETLFNWLQPHIGGSRCLDLFAGTGALGIEAVSRGAAAVTLVEKSPQAVALLSEVCANWPHEDRLQLVHSSAQDFLATPTDRFDIVFVDPPFDAALQSSMLEALTDGHLANGALVYVEAPVTARKNASAGASSSDSLAELPAGYSVAKERRYGEVIARLLEFAH